jgi:hypothetical protein
MSGFKTYKMHTQFCGETFWKEKIGERNGSGLCPMVGFDISAVGPWGSANKVLVN